MAKDDGTGFKAGLGAYQGRGHLEEFPYKYPNKGLELLQKLGWSQGQTLGPSAGIPPDR